MKTQTDKMLKNIISESIIERSKTPACRHVFPEIPKRNDLFKYSKIRLKKKRMRKKFLKRYYAYVARKIWFEYLAKCMVAPIRTSLNYAGLGRKLFRVEELPKCEATIFNFQKTYSHDDITPKDVSESQAEIDMFKDFESFEMDNGSRFYCHVDPAIG